MTHILNNHSLSFLERYVNIPSPSGNERNGQEIWLDYLLPFVDEYFQDAYFNTVAVINPGLKLGVVLEAHADEISWVVNNIDRKGFIRVVANGGADPMVAPGKKVLIHSRSGPVYGVFGWPAVHMRNNNDIPYPVIENLFIDVGASSDFEVENMGITEGVLVTYPDNCQFLNRRYITGRGLDNRIGGLIIAEVARIITENRIKLPFSLMIVNSVQEEVGLYGAKMIAERLHPDMAIVTDVTHDTSTPLSKQELFSHVECGAGPGIAIAPAVHNYMEQLIRESAESARIPYQLFAVTRGTRTDIEAIALSSGGIMSALISPSVRYMHTPVEMVHLSDVNATIALIVETLVNLDYQILMHHRRIPYFTEYERELEMMNSYY